MIRRTSGDDWKRDWVPEAEKPLPSKITSGVYYILCKTTRQGYIGSARDIRDRIKNHFAALGTNQHINKNLQQAFNNYGWADFTWGIVEDCSIIHLQEREQYWIDRYPAERLFNIQRIVNRIQRVTHLREHEALDYLKRYCGIDWNVPRPENGCFAWYLVYDLTLIRSFQYFYPFSLNGRDVAVAGIEHLWGEEWPDFRREAGD